MKIKDFEVELKAINSLLSIEPNPAMPGLARVVFRGVGLCSVPDFEIYDEPRPTYGIHDPRGNFMRHRTRFEAMQKIVSELDNLKDDENRDAFFGEGEYSKVNLERKDSPIILPNETN